MPAFLFPTVPRPSTLHRNLLLDLSTAVGLGATMAVVNVLLPSFARLDGLGAMGLATLAAIPFVASLLSMLAGRVGPRTPRGLAVLRAVGSAALLLVFVIPGPIAIVVATFVFWTAFALGAPLQQRIWTEMYPTSRRGRLLGIVGTGRFAAGTVALLVIGMLIDGAVGLSILAVIAIIGVISALAASRFDLPQSAAARPFSIADSMRSVTQNLVLRRVAYAQVAYGAGLVAAPALFAIVQIDRLGLGLDQVALAGLAIYLTTTATYGLWGQLGSRIGGLPTVGIGAWLGVVAIVLYAVAPSYAVVVLASVALGAGSAAVNVTWPLIIAEHAPREDQSSAAAGLMAIMGARGLIAPFVVMLPVQLGLVGVTAGLLLCAVATGLGALLYMWVGGMLRKPQGVPVRVRGLVSLLGAATRS